MTISTTTPQRAAAAEPRPESATATATATIAAAAHSPAHLAKAALRRLALERHEPTPENFARAYAIEAGDSNPVAALAAKPVTTPPSAANPAVKLVERVLASGLAGSGFDAQALLLAASAGRWDEADRLVTGAIERAVPDGEQLAGLIERIVRGVDQGGKQWTRARKRDSLQRVLSGSRSDANRLKARLSQLVTSWQDDHPDVQADDGLGPPPSTVAEPAADVPKPPTPATPATFSAPVELAATPAPAKVPSMATTEALPWQRATDALGATVCAALPTVPAAAVALIGTTPRDVARRIAESVAALRSQDADPQVVVELESLCGQADRVLQHREHLLDQMGRLCHELTASLADLAEDDSWARGQCAAMRDVLEQGLSTRGVRSVGELLRVTRERQRGLRDERERARDALKSLIQRMLGELGELGSHTGRFETSMHRYADVIENADSLESLTGAVREMVEESRTVAGLVGQTRDRMQAEHSRAQQLADRVDHLESELRRLSTEVSTDQLTQIANRRGLHAQFEIEQARRLRDGSPLCLGLLDIDNFKRLNDELGHAAGDIALKALAQAVKQALRPTDMVARFGGEEFVVVLPGTPPDEAQLILTRLQRGLTGSLFMHDQKPVFVTFSAGVTDHREGETLEATLERADLGLYEAKRNGKNRTCIA